MAEKGNLLMDAQTFIDGAVAAGEDANFQPFWFNLSAGPSVQPMPIFTHDVYVRFFSCVTLISQTAVCFLSSTPDSAATIYSVSGLRPQVIAFAVAANGNFMFVQSVRIRIPAGQPTYVTNDISPTYIYVVLSWPA